MARSRPTEATAAQRHRILDAAEVVLRRYGPTKTNVVDVARELGQTHASVYRYFASKAELIDALVQRWLSQVTEPLGIIARGNDPAPERLRAWLLALHTTKVRKVTAEPEYFATFHALAGLAADEVVARHVAELTGHVRLIIADGIAAGAFQVADLERAANACFNAMFRFHHPALLVPPNRVPTIAEAGEVADLLIAGLRAGVI